jgi:hypothetical protein
MRGLSEVHDVTGFDCCCKRGLRDRLNIIAAAEAHVVWKNRLGHHVRGAGSEPIGAALFGQDGICQLGRLINGSAFSEIRDRDEYRQLRDAHQQFHQLTAVVVEKLEAQDRSGAATLFENEYSAALRDILQSLGRINRLLLE